MKKRIKTLVILLPLFMVHSLHAQTLEKKAFKEASTIRLYVNDTTESAAIDRFTAFVNQTSWTVQPSSTPTEEVNSGQMIDTLQTDVGSLFDFMMGEFQGQLIFYADRDSADKLYIAVSGYASNVSWGGSAKSKMKKGGKGTNWSQRALFKQLNKHLSDYPEVNTILYSSE